MKVRAGENRVNSRFSRFLDLGFKEGGIVKRILNILRRITEAMASLNYQYESKQKLLGWPILSINLGFSEGEMRQARGWVAIGTRATGILCFGIFVSRGLISIGGIAIGLGTVSVFGLGLITVSILGLGLVSVSAFAAGYLAVGILAVGFKSVGILAIGKEATGIICIGQEINSLFNL